jgi:hypothetical protein
MELKLPDYFASIPINGTSVACVGGITTKEAEIASADGVQIDGMGYYLYVADSKDLKKPIEVMAKFISESQAARFARMIRHHTAMPDQS